MNKNVLIGVVVILLIGVGIFLSQDKKETSKILKIGSLSPLSGPYAADGNDIANGVKAAIATIEAQGGIQGFERIEVFPQDSACDPKQAVAAANKLVSMGVAGVIGAYCSSSTIPASEVLNEEKIVMITPASTNEKVTERGLPYMFRMCGRDDDQSETAVKFLKNHLNIKKIYIVDDKTTYSQGLAENINKKCQKLGIQVLAHDHVNQGDKDFSAVLTKIKAAKPDLFYMSLQNSSSGSLMAIQAKRFNLKCPILTQDAVYHPQFIKIAKHAAQGVYFTFGYVDKNKEPYKKYMAQYGKMFKEPGAYSAYAYDSTIVLLNAIKNAKSTDPEKIKKEIMKMDFDGASKHIKFFENGDSNSNYIIQVVEQGKFSNFWNPETGKLY